MEQVRVIIEVRAGQVIATYAGQFVDVLVVDHDTGEVASFENEPEFDKAMAQGYENEFLLFTSGAVRAAEEK